MELPQLEISKNKTHYLSLPKIQYEIYILKITNGNWILMIQEKKAKK